MIYGVKHVSHKGRRRGQVHACIIHRGRVGFTRHAGPCKAPANDNQFMTPTGWLRRPVFREIWGEACFMHESVAGADACMRQKQG